MSTNKLTAEQKITRARVSLMNEGDWRWLAGVLTMGSIKVTDDPNMPTARTNGIDEEYNRQWVDGLTHSEIRFVVLHETFHKMFRHLFVWRNLFKEDPDTANAACDIVINTQYLYGKPNLTFVENGTVIPKYKDSTLWSAKRVYDDLRKQSGGGNNGNDDSDGDGKPTSDQGGKPSKNKPPKGHDMHDWSAAEEMTKEESDKLEAQMDAALRQAAMAGSMSAGMPRGVREMLVPELDWRSYLAEFVKTACVGFDKQTWRRPHRTYVAHDLYMPSPYSENIGRILIAGDTSGSIDDKALSVFLGYMQQLVNEVSPSGVDIAWWGSDVVGVDSFEKGQMDNLVSSVRPKGGGGTEPACITNWMGKQVPKKDYVCAVVITDGEFYNGNVGNWGNLPVLWLVVNDRKVDAIPVGVTVQIPELR